MTDKPHAGNLHVIQWGRAWEDLVDVLGNDTPVISERVAKYNRLLVIEDELGEETARYAGFSAFYNVPALYART